MKNALSLLSFAFVASLLLPTAEGGLPASKATATVKAASKSPAGTATSSPATGGVKKSPLSSSSATSADAAPKALRETLEQFLTDAERRLAERREALAPALKGGFWRETLCNWLGATVEALGSQAKAIAERVRAQLPGCVPPQKDQGGKLNERSSENGTGN